MLERTQYSTQKEWKQLSLQAACLKIQAIYDDPPQLAPQFSSIFAIPLEHHLKLPLQAAEQWISMVAHQVKVTKHNFTLLLKQHKPIQAHVRTRG